MSWRDGNPDDPSAKVKKRGANENPTEGQRYEWEVSNQMDYYSERKLKVGDRNYRNEQELAFEFKLFQGLGMPIKLLALKIFGSLGSLPKRRKDPYENPYANIVKGFISTLQFKLGGANVDVNDEFAMSYIKCFEEVWDETVRQTEVEKIRLIIIETFPPDTIPNYEATRKEILEWVKDRLLERLIRDGMSYILDRH